MDEKKIACITCVNDERLYEEALLYLRRLSLPEGMALELYPVRGAASMASGYNEAMRKSDAKYKIYLHQDVFVIYKEALVDLIHLFRSNAQIGLIGLVGCKALPTNGAWWTADKCCGLVYQALHTESLNRCDFGAVAKPYENVSAVDGFFMATQYDLPWRADLFTDWHLYDLSACMEFAYNDYKVAIPHCEDAWCIHSCGVKELSEAYDAQRRIFLREYGAKCENE